jgi:hypothetical protein
MLRVRQGGPIDDGERQIADVHAGLANDGSAQDV